MELKRVFIVGAGISKGAGLPMRNEFFRYENGKIIWNMNKNEELNIESLRRFLVYFKKIIPVEELSDIEKVWDKVLYLETPRKNYFEKALKDLMARRIIFSTDNYFLAGNNERMKMHKKCVSDFLKSVYNYKDTIVSLNYDTILEEMCSKNKIWFGTDLFLNWSQDKMVSKAFEEGKGKIKLFKLHGSINWLYCDKCKQIKYIGIGELSSPYASGEFYCHKCTSHYTFAKTYTINEESRLMVNGGTFPSIEIVALPMNREKHSNKYKKKVDKIWINAKNEIEKSNKIIIIGYSSINIDTHVRDLIIDAIQKNKNKELLKVEVVCPDPDGSIQKKYEDVFDKIDKKIEYYNGTFEDFIRMKCSNINPMKESQ